MGGEKPPLPPPLLSHTHRLDTGGVIRPDPFDTPTAFEIDKTKKEGGSAPAAAAERETTIYESYKEDHRISAGDSHGAEPGSVSFCSRGA